MDNFICDFTALENEGFTKGFTNGKPHIYNLQREAFSSFAKLGFPTTKNEEWKYTNIAPIAQTKFKLAPKVSNISRESFSQTNPFGSSFGVSAPFLKFANCRLVFVNGYFSQELSQAIPSLNAKIINFKEAVNSDWEIINSHLAQYALFQSNAFVSLNTAFIKDGAFVYIPKEQAIKEPIFIIFISFPGEEPIVSYPRNLVVMGNNSQGTVVEIYLGMGEKVYFTNSVTEIVLGENTTLEHYKMQRESVKAFHIASIDVEEGRNSNFISHSVSIGGSLTRNNLNVMLNGDGGECILNGLYLTNGEQHVDNHTRVDHVMSHCTSRQLYKGIMDGKSRGVFNGKVFVHKTAVKSDARQINKNLLLSEDALIDTKPQLEINTDDVKCSHGSTIGQLDPDALFYLCSRGISYGEARNILTAAFAQEILEQMKVEIVRTHLESCLRKDFIENKKEKVLV